jgi:Transglycosylase SLT domain
VSIVVGAAIGVLLESSILTIHLPYSLTVRFRRTQAFINPAQGHQKAAMNVDPTGTRATVTGAIRQAAQLTGASFKYLLATAQVESNLNPNAQVATSSAKGLFQFIDQTWLSTLKEQGPALGYGPYADAIARTSTGEYAVTDPKMAKAVMNLRSDPNASAVMAAAFTKANGDKLAARLGRDPTEGELYIAHFLGSAGAGRLISIADSRPHTPAAAVFPNAAHSNPSIFYDRQGQARSASEVYRILVGRYQNARGVSASMVAQATSDDEQGAGKAETALLPKIPPIAVPSMEQPAALSAAEIAAETAVQPAAQPVAPPARQLVRAAQQPVVPTAEQRVARQGQQPVARPAAKTFVDAVPVARNDAAQPVFHSLFRTGSEPVAPIVSALWTTPASNSAPAPAAPAPSTEPPAANTSGALDLFQEQRPNMRALFRGRV